MAFMISLQATLWKEKKKKKVQRANVLLPLFTDLFKLLLHDGLLPMTWKKIHPLTRKPSILFHRTTG